MWVSVGAQQIVNGVDVEITFVFGRHYIVVVVAWSDTYGGVCVCSNNVRGIFFC